MMDSNEKVERAEDEVKGEKRILATNAWHLARYLIEHDHERDIPAEINIGQFLNWCEKYPMLRDDEKIQFINQYAKLEKIAGQVTARTLVATRIHGHGFIHAALNTSVGRYLIFLFLLTYFFAGYLLIGIIEPLATHDKVIPFAAAGLGTCVYLLRVTQERLKTRTFDPAYLPSQLIRLVLGTLAGGTIVLFPVFYEETIDIGLTQGLIAFVLGYAVDIYYALLDNIGGKIKIRTVDDAKA